MAIGPSSASNDGSHSVFAAGLRPECFGEESRRKDRLMVERLRPGDIVPAGFVVEDAKITEGRSALSVRSAAAQAKSPGCGTWSSRVQSRYRRTASDLPLSGRAVSLPSSNSTTRRDTTDRRSSSTRGSSVHTPVPCRSRKRRQQVLLERTRSRGSTSHGMPERGTKTIRPRPRGRCIEVGRREVRAAQAAGAARSPPAGHQAQGACSCPPKARSPILLDALRAGSAEPEALQRDVRRPVAPGGGGRHH